MTQLMLSSLILNVYHRFYLLLPSFYKLKLSVMAIDHSALYSYAAVMSRLFSNIK